MTSDNIVLRTLGCFTRSRAVAVGSVYGVDVLSASMCSRHHTPAWERGVVFVCRPCSRCFGPVDRCIGYPTEVG